VRATGLPRVPQPGEDIHAVGGATLVSNLMKVALIDEIRAFVHPVILGGGKAWFKDVDERRALDSPTSGGLRLDPFG